MKIWRTVFASLLSVAIVAASSTVSFAEGSKQNNKSTDRRSEFSYANWSDAQWLKSGQRIDNFTEPKRLSVGESLTLNVATEKSVKWLVLEYKPSKATPKDCLVNISIDGKETVGSLPLPWTDEDDEYRVNRYGNEMYPNQICSEEYIVNPVEDYTSSLKGKLAFEFESGVHTVTITSTTQEIVIKQIALSNIYTAPTYEEYLKTVGTNKGNGIITVEAEKYSLKSDSLIKSTSQSNPVLEPYDTFKKKINVLDGGTCDGAGQKVLWEFEVETEGFYELNMRYSLTNSAGKPSYRTIEIDGKVPFKELENVAVTSKGNGYSNYSFTTQNGKSRPIYLTKGKHTVAMVTVMGPLDDVYNKILNLMTGINDIGTMLQKLTAGSTDKNRTWDMNLYMPGTLDKLKEYKKQIDALYEEIEGLTEDKASYASSLKYASEQLTKLLKKPDQLPNNADMLSVGDSSVSKYLGTVLSSVMSQPVTIDRLYISAEKEVLPKSKVSFFTSIYEAIKAFLHSFTSGAGEGEYGTDFKKDSKELQVWINRPIQYVQVLQQQLDDAYNSEKGTNIKLSIMPSEQKLILANASGTNPDVALGVAYTTPFDFAIRGAAKNLLEYDDFLSTYSKNYNLEALVPTCFANGVYAAVETQDYQVLFYRKDTLETLGLKVPETWDDVKNMMPQLLRYSMNFSVPIASSGGFKSFAVTAPYLYQNGGTIYNETGMNAAFNSNAATKGFTEMVELFNIYGLQQTVADFYNSFRYNRTPIGMGNMSTYIQLQVAAPELAGLWDIAPTPGTRMEDGTICRFQMADSTAAMIFDNTDKPDEAWDLVKWWLSTDTQANFANNLQSTFGTEYRWNTANLNAFDTLSYSDKEKNVILKQWEWQKETARHPSNYMTERELSNAWVNVVINGDGISESLDKAVLQSNREILRKMQEFGYCDEEGNVLKEYRQLTAADLYKMLEEQQKGDKK